MSSINDEVEGNTVRVNKLGRVDEVNHWRESDESMFTYLERIASR